MSQGCGVVFRVTPDGVESGIYSFVGGTGDGAFPTGVVQGSDGSLYGTTTIGGQYLMGAVFKITPAGIETLLHSFSGGSDGQSPMPLVQALDGSFYGAMGTGGTSSNTAANCDGCGTLYRITPAGMETLVYTFNGGANDGSEPRGPLVVGSDGDFYGVASEGGSLADGGYGCGTIFKATPSGSESTLYVFADVGTGGASQCPEASSLIQASDGNLYGVTKYGGQYSAGTVFSLTSAGIQTVIYSFGGGH
jgi:uncharacterized repeat protein (TIGR03803 family)